ncbi:MAG TPA: hypothetical protein VE177_07530, partial [Candidatus Binatus sp.]|nr:hypothetical protein [Candidatus Binatus sp.]
MQIASNSSSAHIIWTDNRFACDKSVAAYGCQDQDAMTATVGLPDFALGPTQLSYSMNQGQTVSVNVTLSTMNSFSGNVALSLSSTPSGLSLGDFPTSLSLRAEANSSFLLVIESSISTQALTFHVKVVGNSGPRSHTLVFPVTVHAFVSLPSSGGFPNVSGPGASFLYAGILLVIVGSLAILSVLLYNRARRRQQPPHQSIGLSPRKEIGL